MAERKRLWSWTTGGIILGLIVGVLIGWSYQPLLVSAPARNISPSENNSVSLMIDYGNGKVQTFDKVAISKSQTVLDTLKDFTASQKIAFDSKTYEGMGTLVTQIGSFKNNDSNRYWQYWVNNQKPTIGAQAQKVMGGDWVEWKFMPFVSEEK